MNRYSGETFVAYVDLSGMKALMQRGHEAAAAALRTFYQAGFDILSDPSVRVGDTVRKPVDGIFVSDCAILFSRMEAEREDAIEQLLAVLEVVKKLNLVMWARDHMLTTSVAYGPFAYEDRIELPNMTKNLLRGSAYLAAYLDNDGGRPKLEPGQCRILRESLPGTVLSALQDTGQKKGELRFIKATPLGRSQDSQLYYYWMARDEDDICDVDEQYRKAAQSKYECIRAMLHSRVDPR
jgi:hypothetical protein